jgi:hypothetical protein
LVLQIDKDAHALTVTPFSSLAVFGMDRKQRQILKDKPIDIVCDPGRLLDFKQAERSIDRWKSSSSMKPTGC